MFNLEYQSKEEGTVIKAAGEMDHSNFNQLKKTVESCLSQGAKHFIFDLTELSYLDSSALGSLLYNQKKINAQKGVLIVIPSQALVEILKLTHLDNYFKIEKDFESARSTLKEAGNENATVKHIFRNRYQ